MMKLLKLHFTTVAAIIMLLTVSCSKSPYDKAMDYLHDLSNEVTSVTDMESYDAVYDKIVRLNSDPMITGLTDLTDNQKRDFTDEMLSLTMDALMVKAILYAMPSDIKPTAKDIKALCAICKEKNLNPLTAELEYSQMNTIIKDYYNIQ